MVKAIKADNKILTFNNTVRKPEKGIFFKSAVSNIDLGKYWLRLTNASSGFSTIAVTYSPVSYTHLDVYKRQIKYTSSNLSTNLWAGTEMFDANSNIIVNSANKDNLFFAANSISSNPSTGALFGNLILQPTAFNTTGNWTGIFPDGIYKLTSNDLTINNSTTRNFTLAGEEFTVGRDFIVNLSSTGDIAADTGSIQITINHDFIKNGTGTGRFRTNGGGTGIYNINGDLKVNAGTFSNNGSTLSLIHI